MSELEQTVETISPKVAETYLGMMVVNRHPSRRKVEQYAEDMKSGSWDLTGEAIKFNTKGKLIDGQNRLLACIKAQKNFRTAVHRNVPDSSFRSLDQGAKRTFGNYLQIKGFGSANNLAAVTLLTFHYYHKQQWSRGVSIPVLAKWFHQNEQALQDTLPMASRPYRGAPKYTGLVPITGAAFILMHHYQAEVAEAFLEGVFLGSENPALRATSSAIKTKTKQHDRGVPAPIILALLLKGANAWLLGQEPQIVKWVQGGPNPEKFPELVLDVEV